MATRQIIFSENPILRGKSRRVRRVSPEVEQLIDDMIETMREANGIGLAAIQVGVPEQVIVVEIPVREDEEEEAEETETEAEREEQQRPLPTEQYVIINPELARTSRETEAGIEGCLSIPGLVGEVERHCAVTVKGLDRQGRKTRIKAEGLLARVFQHEIDHTSGILFIDHIDDPEKIWTVAEGEEEAAEAAQERPQDEH